MPRIVFGSNIKDTGTTRVSATLQLDSNQHFDIQIRVSIVFMFNNLVEIELRNVRSIIIFIINRCIEEKNEFIYLRKGQI